MVEYIFNFQDWLNKESSHILANECFFGQISVNASHTQYVCQAWTIIEKETEFEKATVLPIHQSTAYML